MANLTCQEMELVYADSKRMLIEGQESCRVPVPVDRCPLTKLPGSLWLVTVKCHSKCDILDLYEESDQVKNLIEINRICSEHIAEQVKLQWLLNATDSIGVASLKGITLNSRMLDVVRMSPLEWGKSDSCQKKPVKKKLPTQNFQKWK